MVREQPEAAAATTTTTSGSAASAADATAAAAGAAPAVGTLTDRDEFIIECLRNARYHEDRERFFARIHKTAMFIVVVSGTATFGFAKASPYLGALITVVGTIDLVFDVSGKARLHASLRRRFYDLLAQAEDLERTIPALREQLVRIYADEPPCMHAANLIAFNGAMDALHRPRSRMYQIKLHHRLFRHWWSFASTEFKTLGESSESQAGG